MSMFTKKCDYCRTEIEGKPIQAFDRAFCTRKHVANYFGDSVEESKDEIYWSDFY